MRTFTIDSDNNITAHRELPTGVEPGTHFRTPAELTQLTAAWPMSRLVELWNSFAGVAPFTDLRPVRKFTDRKSAIRRLWTAVDRLPALATEPERTPVAGRLSPAKSRATGKSGTNQRARSATRDRSKKAEVLGLLRRPQGVSLSEIRNLTGWQAHTVRGFVSILGSRGGYRIESTKADSGERTYRITG